MADVKIDDNAVAIYLKDSAKSLSQYAVTNYKLDSFIKSAMLAIVDKPELRECLTTSTGKASLFNALRYAASTGLSLNPQQGKAALIAFGGQVQYQVMKNGIIDLAMRSGKVEFVTCDTVRENDKFEIEKTSDGDKFSFKPAMTDRGKIIGFFAACKLTTGSTMTKWMTLDEIEDHRDRYSAMYKAKPEKSPWTKSFEGMGLKTVIKALFRNLSISDELDSAVGSDDASENEIINITPAPKGTSADDAVEKLKTKEKTVENNSEQSKIDF
jgi:phage RecT family recombinase